MPKYVTVLKSQDGFKFQECDTRPAGKWDEIGLFLRFTDSQQFIALGQGIYADEVDPYILRDQLSEFLGLGKPIR